MNKEILNQIPADEQAVAAKLQAVADDMRLSPAFEWELEIQLMEKHKDKTRPGSGWFARIAPTLGWAFTAICVIFLVNWAIRSLVPSLSAASNTQQPEITTTVVPSNTPQPTPIFTPIPGQIAFVSDESGQDQIYLMNSDGSEILRLTTDDNDDRDPAWSPDGARIAFTRLTGAQEEMPYGKNVLRAVKSAEIIVMDADGSNPVSLTHSLSEQGLAALHPTWSPDGKYIAFQVAKIDTVGNALAGWNIYVAAISGLGELRQVTASAGEIAAGCINAQWLPDSKSILAYCQSSSNETSIVLSNMEDGSNSQILEPRSKVVGHADTLSYQASLSGVVAVGEETIITTLRGTDFLKKISFENGWLWVQELAWSPVTADELAVRTIDGVFVINEDGSQLIKIASFGNYQDPVPSLSWSPDGSQIVFATMQDYQKNILNGNQEIMIAALDHTSMIRLTFTDANESQPVWRPSAAEESSTVERSFEDNVRQGNICAGPLAAGHDFSVSLTNQDKTRFVTVDPQNDATELRSFAWSPDGSQLAVIGNTGGQGNIYLTDSAESPLRPLLSDSNVGYARDASWSRDGNKLVLWSSQNISTMYLVDADGSNLIERELGVQIFGTPQIAPDNRSIIFYGADSSADGLFQARLDGSQPRLINDLVEAASSFAWSPDGTRLAYFEMDRSLGEARLIEKFANGSKIVIASLPIPKGSSSTIPEVANLNWSADGRSVVFDFGNGNFSGRAVYLARADGIGFIKVAESAHSPTISADGRCLAFIRDKQVFVLDLNDPFLSPRSKPLTDFKLPSKPVLMVSLDPDQTAPVLLADIPTGQAASGTDKLQWAPAAILIRWNP